MLPFPSCLQSFEEFEVDWEDPIDYNLKILNENLKRKCKLYTTLEKKQYLSFIHRNMTIHFYRNYFLVDSECPQSEDLQTEFW